MARIERVGHVVLNVKDTVGGHCTGTPMSRWAWS